MPNEAPEALEEHDPSEAALARDMDGVVKACPVCGVRLSAYNPGPNCWRHTIGQPWRGPSAKPRY